MVFLRWQLPLSELLRGINRQVVPPGHGEIRIRTLALDRLAERAIGFIKIDVEGYELEVLRGARNLISRHQPNLFVEVHPQFQLESGRRCSSSATNLGILPMYCSVHSIRSRFGCLEIAASLDVGSEIAHRSSS
jgi:hypothetical protein